MECASLVKGIGYFHDHFCSSLFQNHCLQSSNSYFAACLVAENSDWAVGVISRNLVSENALNLYASEMREIET